MKFASWMAALALVIMCSATSLRADIIPVDLAGVGGTGLLTTNELHGPSGNGSGGEVGAGISYDTDTMQLVINVGWGSLQGFNDLTGNATAAHIHGPADINNTAGVQINLDALPGFSNSGSNGGFAGGVTLTAAQETMLFDGNLYINVHTAANGAGEIRGNLFAIPEPSSVVVLGLAIGGFMIRRRRK